MENSESRSWKDYKSLCRIEKEGEIVEGVKGDQLKVKTERGRYSVKKG